MKATVIATLAPEAIDIGAGALVDAQLRVGHLEVGERPQADDRAVEQQWIVEAEQQPREPAGERTAMS